mgnify:CR=1 FL=1
MRKVYLVEGLRTPFGSLGGSLADVHVAALGATVIKGLVEKLQLDPSEIDEVILGEVLQGGSAQAPARQAMRMAGLPDKVHAMTVNKVCGSGMKSIMLADQSIMLKDSEIAIAGGMESMSMAPYALQKARFGYRLGDAPLIDLLVYDALQDPYSGKHMGLITEDSITKNNISRKEQDDYAIRSYELSQQAVNSGRFSLEIVPVIKSTKKGEVVIDKDEEPFKGDVSKIPSLKPVFKKDGSITAGNASTINDGAAAVVLASEDAVKKYSFKPVAELLAYATNSIHPNDFGEAPVGAIQKILQKSGLKKEDIGLFEINEAFAAVPLMAINQLGLDINKVNVNGGAVSIGHPVGASGGRLTVTLAHEMRLRNVQYGIATLCIGGGEAVAILLKLV